MFLESGPRVTRPNESEARCQGRPSQAEIRWSSSSAPRTDRL